MMCKAVRSAGLALVAVVFAGAALASGADRMGTAALGAASWVPDAFAAQSLAASAQQEIALTRYARAETFARQAIRRLPIEAHAASSLGSSLYAAGRFREADAAFRVAGRMGWRDIPTQGYWFSTALALDDLDTAATRIDAIMRAAPSLPQALTLLQELERQPGGDAAVARRAAESPPWLAAYAASTATLAPPDFARRIAVLRTVSAGGVRPACIDGFDAVNALAYGQGRYAEARSLWQVACAPPGAGAVSDPAFARAVRDTGTPFDWSLSAAGGVFSEIYGGALVARNETPFPVVVARQTLLLPPGPVRMAIDVRPGSAPGVVPALRVACANRNAPLAPAGTPELVVPQGCTPQVLEVVVPPTRSDVMVEGIGVVLPGGAS